MNTKKTGYILVTALLFLSLAVVIAHTIFMQGMLFVPFTTVAVEREKARLVALGGIQVAISQLVQADALDEEEKEVVPKEQKGIKESEDEKRAKKFFKFLFPVLNNWQTFNLKEEVEGISGQLRILVVSEEGKIPITKELFQGPWKTTMQFLFDQMEKRTGTKGLYDKFESFLKERQYKLNDVTELLKIPEFSFFSQSLFYAPSIDAEKKDDKSIYLTDIFTTASTLKTVDPWLFSHSLQKLLGFSFAGDSKSRNQIIGSLVEKFKQSAVWAQEWNTILKPVYGKELQNLPSNMQTILQPLFEPKTFEVTSYAKVGRIVQRLLVILERNKHMQNNKIVYDVKIKKFYWL